MKERYRLFLRRKSVYYAFDNTTKTFECLKTKDRTEATRPIRRSQLNVECLSRRSAAKADSMFRLHLFCAPCAPVAAKSIEDGPLCDHPSPC